MQIYWLVAVAAWVGITAGAATLALYRKFIAREEMDVVHIAPGSAPVIRSQKEFADRLDWIDIWGQRLTLIALVLGAILGGIYLYQVWKATQIPI
jgi:hypothetical protein